MPAPFATNLAQQAAAALRSGDRAAAVSLCEQALRRNKRDVAALSILGQVADLSGRGDQAIDYLGRAIKLQPANPQLRVYLGQVHGSRGEYARAHAHLDAALDARPGLIEAVDTKAMVFEHEGRYDKARALLRPIVEAGSPPPGVAAIYLRVLVRDGELDEAVRLGEQVEAAEHEPGPRLREALFALASAYERRGEHEQVMRVAARANELLAVPFGREAYRRLIDEIMSVCTEAWLAAAPRPAEPSAQPVFIVGMPRTGSTLVERIIASHPAAASVGEHTALPLLTADMQMSIGSTLPYPRCLADLDGQDVESLGRAYLDQVRPEAPRVERIVDKMLGNHLHLGLIQLLFPAARVIHCRRDPLDTCLSCYLERLMPEHVPYAGDLGDLGFVYRQYERLMAHWAAVLQIPLLEVRYEALVDDQEPWTRRIIEFCELPWDEARLQFQRTRSRADTLSYDQVRRPIYRSSLGRAARFGTHLDPLRQALAGD